MFCLINKNKIKDHIEVCIINLDVIIRYEENDHSYANVVFKYMLPDTLAMRQNCDFSRIPEAQFSQDVFS